MNIVVCIKQVPDSATIRMDRERMTIVREGVESIINPLDSVALEAALELRAKAGGEVTVLTMGPPKSESALRESMAAGADYGILLTDPAFRGADTLATSRVLAAAISKMDSFPDLILCGMQTIDSDTGHVGPQVAEELDVPHVCGVNEIRLEHKHVIARRVTDGFLQTVRVQLPALLAVDHGLSPVKDVPLGAMETAFSQKEITVWGLDSLGLKREEVGFEGSATRVWKLTPPEPKRDGEMVSGPSHTLVEALIKKLEALNILDEKDGRH